MATRFGNRIFKYVENFWLRHNLERGPSIREVARGLNSGARKVYSEIDEGSCYFDAGCSIWLEGYGDWTENSPSSDIFIGIDSPRIEKKFEEIMNKKY